MNTLLDHLLRIYPTAKRTTLRRMLQTRRIFINGRSARTLKDPVNESDTVEVRDMHKQQPRPIGLPFRIVHEDEDILVIDKPAGLLTSTTPREKRTTALALVQKYVTANDAKAQLGLIHRLDRDASGLLVFSKNHEAYLSLKRQFFHHTVERIYLALVHGAPTPRSGTIDSRLVERADGSVHSTDQIGKGQRAVTQYETITHLHRQSLLRVSLRTGKKHQIRVQLAERGVPIVNDPVYGDKNSRGRLMLIAAELKLIHPRTDRPVSYKITPPPEFLLV